MKNEIVLLLKEQPGLTSSDIATGLNFPLDKVVLALYDLIDVGAVTVKRVRGVLFYFAN